MSWTYLVDLIIIIIITIIMILQLIVYNTVIISGTVNKSFHRLSFRQALLT